MSTTKPLSSVSRRRHYPALEDQIEIVRGLLALRAAGEFECLYVDALQIRIGIRGELRRLSWEAAEHLVTGRTTVAGLFGMPRRVSRLREAVDRLIQARG